MTFAHNTLLVGVGGQGVLTAAQLLGAAAHAAGHRVVVGELHGMSQRGGSIECAVKVDAEESPMIGNAEADVVLAFEPLEALRALPRMRPNARVLINTAAIVPFELTRTGHAYPSVDAMLAQLRAEAAEVVAIDGIRIVGQSGAARTLNAVMLGAASALGWLPADEESVLAALTVRTARQFQDANRRAFGLGRDAMRARGN